MFHFYEPSSWADPSNAIVAEIPAGLASVSELVSALADGLSFPAYSGQNFDALWDCIRILDGIGKCPLAVIRHMDFPHLPEKDRLTYVGVLRDAVLFWQRRSSEHRLEVWFPRSERRRVRELLHALSPYSE